ncbi:DMT family transporter [Amycolatopsis sp. NPDC059657]|uniref:DMT family transporter n=1 Tax=Amycolatopsis sp. NPDC059657 TaxID=3346899 RepID=UPI00366D0E5D
MRLAAVALLWGSSFLWIKLALRGFSPGQIVLVRLALGGLCLLALCAARGLALPRSPRLLAKIAVAAVFANFVPYLLYGIAEQQVDSSLAGVLNASTPLWTMAIALCVRQEKSVGAWRGAGLVLGFAGTLLCLSPWEAGGALGGALLCLAAAACYGIGYVYTKRFLTGSGLDPVAMVAAQLLVATGLSALTIPVTGMPPVTVRADAIIALVILGVLCTGVAYLFNFRLTVEDGSTVASTVTYLLPIVSVLLGMALLAEPFRWNAIAGMAVALAGVALVRRTSAAAPPLQPPPEPVSARPGSGREEDTHG